MKARWNIVWLLRKSGEIKSYSREYLLLKGGGSMTTGGRKKNSRKLGGRGHYYDEAYLDNGISKGEAERRAWKALSSIMVSGPTHRTR